VLLLVWNPSSAVDMQVKAMAEHAMTGLTMVKLHVATPQQVPDYGTVTANVNVLDTPTLEVIDPSGATTTLTGPMDWTVIYQAVLRARENYSPPEPQHFTKLAAGSPRATFIAKADAICKPSQALAKIHVPSQVGTVPDWAGDTATFIKHALSYAPGDAAWAWSTLPMPHADSAFLHTEIGLLNLGGVQYSAMVSELAKGDLVQARYDSLLAEAAVDQASTGLADYGMIGCFRTASDTTPPATLPPVS
jgi:hypothetical protein